MRMDAEETLAESNENGNMKERIRGQLMQLDPVDKKKATKKFMDRSGKAANKEVNECYPESNRTMRDAFFSGKLQALLLLQQDKLPQRLLVLGGDL
jgi:hypothetical protein